MARSRPLARRPRLFGPLAAILALSAALHGVGLWWGLPQQPEAWAPDELSPLDVFESAEQKFSGGWFRWYPPMHYYVLTLVQLPIFAAVWAGWTRVTEPAVYTVLYVLVRLVSVAMATATVGLTYACARELDDRTTARVAALMTALVPPLVYYGKVANVDGPFVFWYVLALWCYLRTLRHGRLADVVGLALAAACAVATKDQAFGLFVGLPVALAIADARRQRALGLTATWQSVVINRQTVVAGVSGLGLLAVLENVAFNWTGFLDRLRWLPQAPTGWELVPNTPAGHLRLLGLGLEHLRFSLGWPFFVSVVAGLLWSLREWRHERRRLALLVPVVSYWLLLIVPIRQITDRYLLPLTVTLVLFGAPAVAWLWNVPRFRWVGRALVTVAFGYAVARAASIDGLMLTDTRYAAERWMATHVPRNARVVGIGHRTYHPRLHDFDAHYLATPTASAIAGLAPEFVLETGAYREDRFPDRPAVLECFSRLRDGSLGYVPVWRSRGRPPWSLLSVRGLETNLDKISPDIVIYLRRRPPSGQR